MPHFELKRVYEDYSTDDGYRMLVDRLWPRGIKKEALKCDVWAKDLAPSSELRKWFHADMENRWNEFSELYTKELDSSQLAQNFIDRITQHETITLLYASTNTFQNHAMVLKSYLENQLDENK